MEWLLMNSSPISYRRAQGPRLTLGGDVYNSYFRRPHQSLQKSNGFRRKQTCSFGFCSISQILMGINIIFLLLFTTHYWRVFYPRWKMIESTSWRWILSQYLPQLSQEQSFVRVENGGEYEYVSLHSGELVNKNNENLILGFAFGVDDFHLSIFCSTLLRAANTSTPTVVLFLNSVPSEKIDLHFNHSITFVVVDVKEALPERYHSYDSTNLRHIVFRRFLIERERFMTYRYVLLVSVRNLYFQRDPFLLFDSEAKAYDEGRGERSGERASSSILHVFQRGGFKTIGEYVGLNKILKKCFNSSIVADLQTKKTFLPSVIAGEMESVMTYLERMVGGLSGETMTIGGGKESSMITHYQSSTFTCETRNTDNVILDVLIHMRGSVFGSSIQVQMHTEHDRKVFLVAMKSSKLYTIVNDNGQVFDVNGGLVPMIYEYETNPDLHAYLVNQLYPFLEMQDPLSEWKSTSACADYVLAIGYDVFKGTCRLQMVPTLSPALCCSICNDAKGNSPCHAFYFDEGLCYLKHCETMMHFQGAIAQYESKRDSRKEGTYTAYVPPKLGYIPASVPKRPRPRISQQRERDKQ